AATVMATAPFSTQATDTKTTDYVGNKVYENGTLKRTLIDGGYIEGTTYHFFLTDHLGNNRVVAKADGTVIQKNHYYPFGMAFAENTTAEQGLQPYKYNGKELDQMRGLNMYDYSARFYEPAYGRTPTPDPHAENYYSWSPYAWVGNNPMRNIDPFGTDVWTTNDPDQIARFFNHLQAVSGNKTSNPFDYGGWNRMTDDEYKEHNKDKSV
uniref:RHS repeat-associated core domain-containing protein n=1 Tax=Dysgonomonas gadei TaxID=156974 RepID=UPI003AF00B1A